MNRYPNSELWLGGMASKSLPRHRNVYSACPSIDREAIGYWDLLGSHVWLGLCASAVRTRDH
jgi:hypothetical protein